MSAETLPSTDARKVWTQFMEFESTVGDLSSIKKVEKRVLASQTVSINIQILTVVIIKDYTFKSLSFTPYRDNRIIFNVILFM